VNRQIMEVETWREIELYLQFLIQLVGTQIKRLRLEWGKCKGSFVGHSVNGRVENYQCQQFEHHNLEPETVSSDVLYTIGHNSIDA
jgi:hypothetical protein